MHALNILHVFRAPVGGLFRHVLDLTRGQIARGHRVGIVADSSTGGGHAEKILGELAPQLALGLTRIPMRRHLGFGDAAAAWHTSRRAGAARADVIHGHGAKGAAYARLAPSPRSSIRVYTPHGGSLLLDHSTLVGTLYLGLERILMPRTDVFLFESAYSAEIFRRKIGKPKGLVRVVHNGVARSEFAAVEAAVDASDLLFIGELRPIKGIDILIEAIGRLNRGGRTVTATLIGDGPDRQALAAQVAARGLTRVVRFMPAMPAREAFARGRVMVVPSRAESLPYVVLEAAAAAKPLISTGVGGIPEIYGPLGGGLVPAGNAEALARAIAATLDQPHRGADTAQKLQQRVAALFSVDAMVEGVLAAYAEAQAVGHAERAALTVS